MLDYHGPIPSCRERVPGGRQCPLGFAPACLPRCSFSPTTPSPAAEKTFQDDALNDAAITLEADLKDEAGTVEKPVIKLRQEADAAASRAQDLAGAADIYVQIVTVAPNDAAAWRRLADLWLTDPGHRRGRRLDALRAGDAPRPISPISARPRRTRSRPRWSRSPAPYGKRERVAPGAERAEARAHA